MGLGAVQLFQAHLIRKPNDIDQDEYDEFYKSITKDKNGPIKTSSSGRSTPPKSSSESLRIPLTKLAKMLRFTSSSGRLTSLDEYVKRMKDKQKSIYYISGHRGPEQRHI